MENKLIPLTEFVNRIDELVPQDLGQHYEEWRMRQMAIVKRYAAFLSQPLTLSMFVPCDEEGNVLEEPAIYESWLNDEESVFYHEGNGKECLTYHKAKQRCLFEGFSICDRGNKDCVVHIGEHFLTWKGKNIEYLVPYNLPLNETAINQIYG